MKTKGVSIFFSSLPTLDCVTAESSILQETGRKDTNTETLSNTVV